MAYQDPKHLRDHEVKIRFDEATMNTIDGLAFICRKQRAVLLRELILEEIRRRLDIERTEASVDGSRKGRP